MLILGWNKTTLLDYPEKVAATIFTGGCNWRCPFCHNGDLVLRPAALPPFSEEEVFAFLEKRRGILDGVCITGGEPTLQKDLPDFLRKVKALGYLVKLDTNGTNPKMLEALLEEGLLDYIAMDIKATPEKYEIACGTPVVLEDIFRSVEILQRQAPDYEFRTTVVKGIHQPEDFEAIGRWLRGSKAYFLQSYQESEQVLCKGFEAFTKEELEQMRILASRFIDKVILRGIE